MDLRSRLRVGVISDRHAFWIITVVDTEHDTSHVPSLTGEFHGLLDSRQTNGERNDHTSVVVLALVHAEMGARRDPKLRCALSLQQFVLVDDEASSTDVDTRPVGRCVYNDS
jgi:hypothetical protein